MKTMKNLKIFMIVLVTMFSLSAFASVEVVMPIEKKNLTEFVKTNVVNSVSAETFDFNYENFVQDNYIFVSNQSSNKYGYSESKIYFNFLYDQVKYKRLYSCNLKYNYVIDKKSILYSTGILCNQIRC